MQLLSVLIGLLIPFISKLIYQAGYSPLNLDLVPLLLWFHLLCYGLAFLSFRMVQVAPIAKEEVFESMRDGVLVLNRQNKLVDFNPAATQIITGLSKKSIGKDIRIITNDIYHLLFLYFQPISLPSLAYNFH